MLGSRNSYSPLRVMAPNVVSDCAEFKALSGTKLYNLPVRLHNSINNAKY